MANGTIHQFEPRLNGALADLLHLFADVQSFDMFVGAEFEIDLIRIVDGILRQRFADQLRKISPDLAAQRQFSVRERARPRKARRDMAIGLAIHTFLRLDFRTMTIFHRLPLLDDDDFFLAVLPQHLDRREDTRRPRAYDDYIRFHVLSLRKLF